MRSRAGDLETEPSCSRGTRRREWFLRVGILQARQQYMNLKGRVVMGPLQQFDASEGACRTRGTGCKSLRFDIYFMDWRGTEH